MLKNIKKYETFSIAISILLIVFSFFLIFKPQMSLNFMVILIGIALIILGIVHMVMYFSSDKENKVVSTELIEGTVYSVIGLFLVIKPNMLNQFLGIIVGIWQILQFIVKFQFTFNLKSASSNVWPFMLVNGILHLAFGILILVNPLDAVVTITTISGIVLLVTEVCNIVESVVFLRNAKNIE